ncbi:hypothetical protein Tco_0855652, partial [Tanacetum coccineum]
LFFYGPLISKKAASLPLIQELACAAGSDVTKDQFVVLFEREVAESVRKIEEYRRLCNDYIFKLMLYRSCDDILGSIVMVRRMQLNDTENVACLLSMARETQHKADEKTAFITRIKERTSGITL